MNFRALGILAFIFTTKALAQQWGPEIRVTDHPGNSSWPDIAADSKGNVHIVWMDDRDSASPPWGNLEIYYAKLDKNGKLVIRDKRLTRNERAARYPRVVVDSRDNVHVFWREGHAIHNNDFDVRYSKLRPDGTIAIDTMQVAKGRGYLAGTLISAVDLDSRNNIHLIWDEVYVYTAPDSHRYEVFRLCYTKMDTSGHILIDKVQLTDPGPHYREPALAVDRNDNLQITWVDNTAPPGLYKKYWVIRYMKADNVGNTLIKPFAITPAYIADSRYPALIVDSRNKVHCVFNDGREKETGSMEQFYTKLDGVGKTLIEDTNISHTPQSSGRCDMSIDANDNIHIVWFENAPPQKILYTKINGDGVVLVPIQKVDQGSSGVEYARIAVDPLGRVHFVWVDFRNGTPEPATSDIYYRRMAGVTTGIAQNSQPEKVAPETYQLYQNIPNPFRHTTLISYDLPAASEVKLEIYNLSGQLARTLIAGYQTKGHHQIPWNGRDENNRSLPAGIYFGRLTTNPRLTNEIFPINQSTNLQTIKLLLLR